MGNTLRRLLSNVAGSKIIGEMGMLLSPQQLGYGVKGGGGSEPSSEALFARS